MNYTYADIKIILFDLGNVVFQLHINRSLEFFSKILNKPKIIHDLSPVPEKLYNQFEKGFIHHSIIRKALEKRWQTNISDSVFINGLNQEIGEPFPCMKNFLSNYSKKIPSFVLSNTNEIHMQFIYTTYPNLMKNFKKIFTSFELHLRKPEPEIYHKIVKEIQLRPKEILFLDDKKENIESASEVGMQVEWIEDPRRLKKVLNNLHFIPH